MGGKGLGDGSVRVFSKMDTGIQFADKGLRFLTIHQEEDDHGGDMEY